MKCGDLQSLLADQTLIRAGNPVDASIRCGRMMDK